MIDNNYFYLIFILFSFFGINSCLEDMCPTGMRKTYVDDTNMQEYGSARKFLAAVCFFGFPGSLFFSRKMLIEPRFEVHLKATIDAADIVEHSVEQKLYGFTIVISGYNNTVSGLEVVNSRDPVILDIGYNNFINSYIIEFDFEQNLYDPDPNSFSIRFCDKTCSSYDNVALYNNILNDQRFNPNKTNNWDFRLIYDSKMIKLYSGPNTLIYSGNFDLENKLGTNIAYVGFTGRMGGNKRELSLIGSFVCEDNFQISKMLGFFYINGNTYETQRYEAGASINYLFSFINNKNQTIPHTFGYNIWNYTFSLTTDCGITSYNITKETNYTLIGHINGCTKAGNHSINIGEKLKGNS